MTTKLHESFALRDEIEGSSDRAFGIVFTVVFFVAGLWPSLFGQGDIRLWAMIAAAAILLVAIVIPRILAPANRLWGRFGLLLHKVVNPIVMGLIFFLTVTPTGMIMRALGKTPLTLEADPEAESYWILRDPPGPQPKSMADQF